MSRYCIEANNVVKSLAMHNAQGRLIVCNMRFTFCPMSDASDSERTRYGAFRPLRFGPEAYLIEVVTGDMPVGMGGQAEEGCKSIICLRGPFLRALLLRWYVLLNSAESCTSTNSGSTAKAISVFAASSTICSTLGPAGNPFDSCVEFVQASVAEAISPNRLKQAGRRCRFIPQALNMQFLRNNLRAWQLSHKGEILWLQ